METNLTPSVAILQKLRSVHDEVQFAQKRGQHAQGYSFVQALDIVRDLRAALLAQNIIVIPATVPGSLRHHTETGGKQFVTTIDLVYRFTDTETGEFVDVPWTGAGADIGGDKGLYKAYTGGLKYALLSLFLLPTTDDPEHDGLTQPEPEPAATTTVDKDAERPAAPRIPLDRARLLMEQAVAAGLATPPSEEGQAYEMTAVLKAQLQTLGVTKVGSLDVDKAETLEAFIHAERADMADAAEVAAAKAEAETEVPAPGDVMEVQAEAGS